MRWLRLDVEQIADVPFSWVLEVVLVILLVPQDAHWSWLHVPVPQIVDEIMEVTQFAFLEHVRTHSGADCRRPSAHRLPRSRLTGGSLEVDQSDVRSSAFFGLRTFRRGGPR